MHIVRMILEHVVVCKVSELALHQIWLFLKRAFESVVNLLFVFLFASVLKELERLQQGLAAFFLLIVIAAVSGVSLGLQAKTSNAG